MFTTVLNGPMVLCVEQEGTLRVAKCHGYDGYIRVKILAGWDKSLGKHPIWPNQAFFWENLYNVCKTLVYKLA